MYYLQGDDTSFGHTTLVNLASDSKLLWVHVVLTFLFFPMTIIIMRRFSVGVGFKEISMEISRTLLVEHVETKFSGAERDMKRFLEEAFPGVEVVDVRLAYDVANLEGIHESLQSVKMGKQYVASHLDNWSPHSKVLLSLIHCSFGLILILNDSIAL